MHVTVSQEMDVSMPPEIRLMADRMSKLEARCNELQATVELLSRRVETLEARDHPHTLSPLDSSISDSQNDQIMAEAGYWETQSRDRPLDFSMVPSPNNASLGGQTILTPDQRSHQRG